MTKAIPSARLGLVSRNIRENDGNTRADCFSGVFRAAMSKCAVKPNGQDVGRAAVAVVAGVID